MEFRKVLVIQLRQLGDILLTTPCVRAIKAERPQTFVAFLCHRMGRKILDGCPELDAIFEYHESDSWLDTLRLWSAIRQEKFDLVLDFMNNPRSALATLMSGAPHRIGFAGARFFAYTQRCPLFVEPGYIVCEKFLLLKACGLKPQDTQPSIATSSADTEPTLAFLRSEPRFAEAPLRIALSPTHRRAERRWSGERYIALADRLSREWGACVTWLWGPGEATAVAELKAQCQLPSLLAPRLSFKELAVFLSAHDLFIGNSNGPSHVAVAAGICNLQLHGPTSAPAWSPLDERQRAIQSPELGHKKNPKVDAISVEDVWAELCAMHPVLADFAARRFPSSAFQEPAKPSSTPM